MCVGGEDVCVLSFVLVCMFAPVCVNGCLLCVCVCVVHQWGGGNAIDNAAVIN